MCSKELQLTAAKMQSGCHSRSYSRRTADRLFVRHHGQVRLSCRNVTCRAQERPGNPLINGGVSLITETLRVLGVGQRQYKDIAARPSASAPLARGDVAGVIARISADFDNAYFVTGIIDDSIYDADCLFADPTVSFRGVDLWKRNLQLLVPFLDKPRVQMISIHGSGLETSTPAAVLRAEWRLSTHLKLPWRPLIDILGATEYTLDDSSTKVVAHVESWNVSALQAIGQIFRPGDRESSG